VADDKLGVFRQYRPGRRDTFRYCRSSWPHGFPRPFSTVAGGFIVAPNDQRGANKASQISNIL
jgi:hypothetical protein